MAKACTKKNSRGKPCGMPPMRGKKTCLAHSPDAKRTAQEARKKGGRRRGKQQQRKAAAPPPTSPPPSLDWRDLQTVAQVDEAIAYVTRSVIDGSMGSMEGQAAAKLLTLARDAADRRHRENLRADAKAKRRRAGELTGEAALKFAATALVEVIEEADADPALAPEERRAQKLAAANGLTKAAQPEKVIEELSADLRAAHADIVELEERVRAPQESTGHPRGSPPPPEH